MTHSPAGSRIVVGIDGSAASDAAVRWAVREARLRHATVHLVSAYYSDRSLRAQYVPPSSWMTPEHDRRAAGALLAAAVDIARRYLSTGRLMAEVANEPPVRALLDRSAHAELLVLGTTRPRPQPGQPPQAMGPVARPCLRMAHCPVVVVSPEDLPAGGTTAGYASRMRRPARRPGSAARQHSLAGRRAGARYSPADAPQPEIAAKDLSPGPVADFPGQQEPAEQSWHARLSGLRCLWAYLPALSWCASRVGGVVPGSKRRPDEPVGTGPAEFPSDLPAVRDSRRCRGRGKPARWGRYRRLQPGDGHEHRAGGAPGDNLAPWAGALTTRTWPAPQVHRQGLRQPHRPAGPGDPQGRPGQGQYPAAA